MNEGSSCIERQPQRRRLTDKQASIKNGGHDTADDDLVMWEGDILYNAAASISYRVEALLGCGTFGQVVGCMSSEEQSVAVKVIKNQQSYFDQAMIEMHILKLLNEHHDPDASHLVRMLGCFLHRNHLCIVFERLHINLFEVLCRNGYNGVSMNLVRQITKQVLEAMCVLRRTRIIHCDLKPENIMLVSELEPQVKVIDFGCACFESQTVYTYIQSRFYRSPEVLLGHTYDSMVDVWSLGCIAAELFLGLPLFPGASDYDMLKRIEEFIGLPSPKYISECKNVRKLFVRTDAYGKDVGDDFVGCTQYRLMTEEEFEAKHKSKPDMGKHYFRHLGSLEKSKEPIRLDDVILHYPLDNQQPFEEQEKEKLGRYSFVDFLAGILMPDPATRWTPWQAMQHPFITGEQFTGPFNPPMEMAAAQSPGVRTYRVGSIAAQPSFGARIPCPMSSPPASAQNWPQPCSNSVASIAAAAVAFAAASAFHDPRSDAGTPTSAALMQAMSRVGGPPCSVGTSLPNSLPFGQNLVQNAWAFALQSDAQHRYSVDGSYSKSAAGQASYPSAQLATPPSSSHHFQDPNTLRLYGVDPASLNSAAFAAASKAAVAYYGSLQGAGPSSDLGMSGAGEMSQPHINASYGSYAASIHGTRIPLHAPSVGASANGESAPSNFRWVMPSSLPNADVGDARTSTARQLINASHAASPPSYPPAKLEALGSSPAGGNEWDPFFTEPSDQDCVFLGNRSDDMASELADEDTRSQLSPVQTPEEPLEVMSARANESQGHSQVQHWPNPGGGLHSHHQAYGGGNSITGVSAPEPNTHHAAPAVSNKGWGSHPMQTPGHRYIEHGGKNADSHVIVVDQRDVLGTSGSDVFGLSFDQFSTRDNSDSHVQPLLQGASADGSAPAQLWHHKDQQPHHQAVHHLEPELECGDLEAPCAPLTMTSYPVMAMHGKNNAQIDAAGVRLGIAGSGVGPAFWHTSVAGGDESMAQ